MSEKMELPKGWILDYLGEYIVKGGGTVDPSRFKDEEFELYSIPAYDSQVPEIVNGVQIGSTKKVVQDNDVLLSRIVPHIQRSWVVPATHGKRKIGSGEWIIFRGNTFTPKYLRFFLLSYEFHQKFMKTISGVGGSLTRANPNQVALFPIPLPPLHEQYRIIAKIEELFSSLDKGIENLKIAQAQLRTYRQAVLKWAFEGKLTNEDVKDGELPEGWKWKRVSEISRVVRGGSPRPAGDPRYYNGIIPFLKVADLTKDEKVYLTTFEYTIKEAGLHKTRQIEPNTLLLTNSGATLGVPKICMINATMNDGIAAFLDLDKRSLCYLFYFWVSKTRELRTINQGAAQPNLNTEIIKNYEVAFPPTFEEQSLIVSEIEKRLSVCNKLEESIAQSLLQAEALRQSILKKAFEGKLVPQDPDDEPASVLLQWIKAERAAVVAKKCNSWRKKCDKCCWGTWNAGWETGQEEG